MSDLIAFLRARIDEEEVATLRLVAELPLPDLTTWEPDGRSVRMGRASMFDTQPVMAEHIARHDPARVLAECKSKRHIVAECVDWLDIAQDGDGHAMQSWNTLRLLAAPYADHPDYDEEWAP